MQAIAGTAQLSPTEALQERPYFANNRQALSLQEQEAWLEQGSEQRRLDGNCSIGRAALNTLVVDSPKVSRLHSIIHLEENGAFWLIDLVSSNGTFLNRRRIYDRHLGGEVPKNVERITDVTNQTRVNPTVIDRRYKQLAAEAAATTQATARRRFLDGSGNLLCIRVVWRLGRRLRLRRL
jgi:hypothetical protein